MSDIYGEYVPPEIAVTVEGQEISVSVVQGLKGEDGADGVTINTLTEKEALVDNDLILIEDSEASNAQKKIKASNLPSGVSEETVLGYIIALS